MTKRHSLPSCLDMTMKTYTILPSMVLLAHSDDEKDLTFVMVCMLPPPGLQEHIVEEPK